MRCQFTLGGMFALMMVVCAYIATALHADDTLSSEVFSIINPVILLLALLAWLEPGFLNRATTAAWRAVTRVM